MLVKKAEEAKRSSQEAQATLDQLREDQAAKVHSHSFSTVHD
jgi:hypothetical protein